MILKFACAVHLSDVNMVCFRGRGREVTIELCRHHRLLFEWRPLRGVGRGISVCVSDNNNNNDDNDDDNIDDDDDDDDDDDNN